MNTLAALTLAYRPFLEPLDFHSSWLFLLPPLVFAIALVYKALKMPTLKGLALETLRLTAYILTLLCLAAVALWGIVEYV
ncbi:MAG: hypothetical protein GC162_16790 [Planctomycetes bacterium]|nr:hypothetical protein [Planctomycetota bacterium]